METVRATIVGIHDLAGTKRNEKTMLDALYGSQDALTRRPSTMAQAVKLAYEGAKKGAENTKEMIATKGRAKFLGERSKGFMDAGSCSVSFIFETIAEVFGGEVKVILDCDNTMGVRKSDGRMMASTFAYLYAHPDVEILGITCTFANNNEHVAYYNTLQMLEDLEITDVPVLKGGRTPEAYDSEAVDFLIDTVNKNPGGDHRYCHRFYVQYCRSIYERS